MQSALYGRGQLIVKWKFEDMDILFGTAKRSRSVRWVTRSMDPRRLCSEGVTHESIIGCTWKSRENVRSPIGISVAAAAAPVRLRDPEPPLGLINSRAQFL